MSIINHFRDNRSTLGTFLKYLVPCMFAMALVAVYAFTDTFVVGRKLGAIALGAMGICTPILTITYAIGFMFGIGGGCLYSIFKGQRDDVRANTVFTTSAVCMMAFGVVLAVVGNIFIEPFAYFLGADAENIVYVLPYLRCILCYIPGFMLDQLLSCYMRNDGHPNTAMVAIVIGTAANVILDFLFVFGFGWGMFGAAFATCLCSLLTILINLGYSIYKRLNIRIQLHNFDINYLWRILRNGFSVFVLESSAGIVTFAFILQSTSLYGTIGASIYTIIMNWTLITVNLVLGITQAAQPLISISFGAKEYGKMYSYRKYSIVTGLLIGLVFLIIGYTFTTPWVSVFTGADASLVDETVSAMRLYLPAYFVMSIGICIGIYFQSIESATKSLIIMLLRGIIIPVAGIIILPIWLDKVGLWLAIPIAETITAMVALLLMFKEKKLVVAVGEHLTNAVNSCMHEIITISRQFGSNGRAIGQELARRLGYPIYDKQMNEMTSGLTGYNEQVIQETEKDVSMPLGFFLNRHYVPISQQIFLAQCRVIEQVASKGPCVIIGRCAGEVLEGKYPTFNIFIHAPLPQRITRVKCYEHCNEAEAEKLIEESDNARAEYHNFFTHKTWGSMENYELSINSSIGTDACVEAIIACIKNKSNGVKD